MPRVRLILILATPCLLALMSPSSVFATCGDYLMHHSPTHTAVTPSNQTHTEERDSAKTFPADQPDDSPCRQGHCQSCPSLPAQAPTTVVVSPEQTAILNSPYYLKSLAESTLVIRNICDWQSTSKQRIDRPPRVS